MSKIKFRYLKTQLNYFRKTRAQLPGCQYASKNDYCYGPANWPSCDYDYGDCIWVNAGCPEENGVGDGICHNGNNVEHCGFDGGDCEGHVQDQCFRPDWFGDQGCDDENNLEICGWDGGDCYYPNRSKLHTGAKIDILTKN